MREEKERKNARTGLQLGLLGLADDELVELLLIFGAEVLQALLGFGGDLKLVHGLWLDVENVGFLLKMRGGGGCGLWVI